MQIVMGSVANAVRYRLAGEFNTSHAQCSCSLPVKLFFVKRNVLRRIEKRKAVRRSRPLCLAFEIAAVPH